MHFFQGILAAFCCWFCFQWRFASAAPDALACTAFVLPFPELLWETDTREGPSDAIAVMSCAGGICLLPSIVLGSITNWEPGREALHIGREEVWYEGATGWSTRSSAQRPEAKTRMSV